MAALTRLVHQASGGVLVLIFHWQEDVAGTHSSPPQQAKDRAFVKIKVYVIFLQLCMSVETFPQQFTTVSFTVFTDDPRPDSFSRLSTQVPQPVRPVVFCNANRSSIPLSERRTVLGQGYVPSVVVGEVEACNRETVQAVCQQASGQRFKVQSGTCKNNRQPGTKMSPFSIS